MHHSQLKGARGFAPILIVYILAGLGAILFVTKPKFLNGDSKRAGTAVATTEKVLAATSNQSAKAGAVFAKIGETNAEAPDSPQKRVIGRFSTLGLSFTDAPDAAFMLALEKLKTAELSGKVAEAEKINGSLLQDAEKTRATLAKAISDKRASDTALVEEAAERIGAERARNWAILAVLVAVGLYLYVKLTHLSPGAVSTVATDIRAGVPPLQALDSSTTRLQQWYISTLAKLKAKL